MLLRELRERVCAANRALPQYGLVTMTSGNVSGRDSDSGLVVIKPSGVPFDDLTPANMVVVDLEGRLIEGEHGASSDTESHIYVYRQRDDIHGMVHTHSNYATAFAAVGQGIPVYLTAIADEFGGEIPCGAYARIGGSAIGEEIIRSIGQSLAILMKQHGVFTIGKSPEAALKAAVMVEDIAKTIWLAKQLGTLEPLPAEEIAANFDRYQNRYGTMDASKGS